MFDPCQLSAYTRIPLCCISTHVDFWESRGSQRWIQDVGWLLRIRRYWRSKDTWEYGVWATRRTLSLIMVEGGKGENKGRYVIENRIDALIDELNVDKNRITGVSHKSVGWNIKMMTTTALLCTLSITPYIYINLVANNLDLKRGTIWVFPILRSTGGFITALLIQLLIQWRITTISYQI